MCGLFGLVRARDRDRDPDRQDAHPDWASCAFALLGHYAQERGRHGAGFALIADRPPAPVRLPPRAAASRRDLTVDGCRVVKRLGAFADLWDRAYLPALDAAAVLLGHTRWATQGRYDRLANASPMLVGHLVGTHNGDIDAHSLSAELALPFPPGTTDTEVLLHALNDVRRHRAGMCELLETVAGRTALVWVDRGRPDRVYLARAALSPLAVATDRDGNLYWASNPAWLRAVDDHLDGRLGIHDVTMLREGTLLTVRIQDGPPRVVDARQFRPLARLSDLLLPDRVVWRGLPAADIADDKAQARHRVRRARPYLRDLDWDRARQRQQEEELRVPPARRRRASNRPAPTGTGPIVVPAADPEADTA